jgi:hypothetical protein|tara:strand:+ start:141 stop:512 length:372 start_codon:yes stop_codon:yes gene_type:complete
MASFVEIDENSIVLRGLVVPDDEEHRGQEFLADDLGLGGTWIQTSYNTHGNVHRLGGTPFRYNYAGIGHTWDAENEAFYAPQPYGSWALDENYVWQPPTPMPDDGNVYYWDEDTTSWIEAEAS